MKVEDLHLGPLSTRRQHRRTPRRNQPEDPRKRSLQNQAAPMGSVQTSTGKQDAHDYQSNHPTQDTNTWVQRKEKLFAEKAVAGSTNN